jgi:CrcB protein
MPYAFLAVFGGAGLGASLRWWLSATLNPVFPTLPLGTLAANLLGGYLVGVAVAYFSHNSALPPEVRLLLITGFLGGLTTLSTFSSEVVNLLARSVHVGTRCDGGASHRFALADRPRHRERQCAGSRQLRGYMTKEE